MTCSGEITQNPRRGSIWQGCETAPSKPSVQTRQLLAAMDDNTTSLKAMMETILARLDEQKVDSDKRLEAQISFNTQVSQDLRSLAKQVDLT